MTIAYGVDFGTSRSSIAVAGPDGQVTCAVPLDAPPELTEPSMPSSVLRQRDGRVVVGYEAENAKRLYPTGYRREIKLAVGRPSVPLGDLEYPPAALVAELLGKLRAAAERVGPGRPGAVVLTAPSGWESAARACLVEAAVAAGFEAEVVALEPEPVAALTHVCDRPDGDTAGTVLVYDLGGGTFDCAVARGGPDAFEVYGEPDGLSDAGGRTFDRAVTQLLARQLPAIAESPGDADSSHDLRASIRLRDDSERIKHLLSTMDQVTTEIFPYGPVTVSRAEFEDRIAAAVTATVDTCERMLAGNGLDWGAVDRIAAVGGSSRIPLVATMLRRRSGRPVVVVDEPELAVVRGAARLAGRRAGVIRPPVRRTRPQPGPTTPDRGPARASAWADAVVWDRAVQEEVTTDIPIAALVSPVAPAPAAIPEPGSPPSAPPGGERATEPSRPVWTPRFVSETGRRSSPLIVVTVCVVVLAAVLAFVFLS